MEDGEKTHCICDVTETCPVESQDKMLNMPAKQQYISIVSVWMLARQHWHLAQSAIVPNRPHRVASVAVSSR